MKVTLIQMNSIDDKAVNLANARALIDQGIREGCDLNVVKSRVGTFCALAARVKA